MNSPQLLMLSGIGPAAHLKEMGIEVVHDSADVGGNLQDHLDMMVQWTCKQPVSLNGNLGFFVEDDGAGQMGVRQDRQCRAHADADGRLHFQPRGPGGARSAIALHAACSARRMAAAK